jgi:hypothetical protein
MPTKGNPRSTTRTTPASRTSGGRKPVPVSAPAAPKPTTRRPNGGNGGNGKPNEAWPVSLVLAAEVELAIEGQDATVDGFSVCTRCAAVLPGSEISRALHARFHEQVDGIDSRVG